MRSILNFKKLQIQFFLLLLTLISSCGILDSFKETTIKVVSLSHKFEEIVNDTDTVTVHYKCEINPRKDNVILQVQGYGSMIVGVYDADTLSNSTKSGSVTFLRNNLGIVNYHIDNQRNARVYRYKLVLKSDGEDLAESNVFSISGPNTW